MDSTSPPVVFFDIGGTLAIPRLSATAPPRLIGLTVYPYVPSVLARLHERGARLGVISSTAT